ncbi:hypothetical protein EVAR_97256_1 [Eumeta japonica]|uniref:Uncharacterized protein n=1 Tax=Eumeta variegata TaxID=151549 RepID=A0A4C1ZDD6_EUMVA|nr:hypothetical protein EVAR_97256_1 [Eumeta japonica]
MSIATLIIIHARSRDVNSDGRLPATAQKSHGSAIVHALAAPRRVRPQRGLITTAITVAKSKATLEVLTVNYKGPPRGGIDGAVLNLPLRTAAIRILSAHRADSIGAGDDFIKAPPIIIAH